MIALFPDSNLFLQCKDMKDLPWHEISETEEIKIIISRTVRDEIDRLKHDGNARRSSRARKANSFLRKIIISEENIFRVRESNPPVVLTFAAPEPEIEMAEALDLSRPDDRIVNEALVFKSKNENIEVKLLTHDTNPLYTAKSVGLEFHVIPDGWLLPPEPDKRDKIIEKLNEEIREFKKNYPEINLKTENSDGSAIKDKLNIHIKKYEKLGSEEISDLVTNCRDSRPICTDFGPSKIEKLNKKIAPFSGAGFRWKYKPPTERSIQKYKDEEYPDWLDDLEEFFSKLHLEIGRLDNNHKITLLLENSGNFPAENLNVEIDALGKILFRAPESKKSSKKHLSIKEQFPNPPTPPKGSWVAHNPYSIYEDFLKPATHSLAHINAIDQGLLDSARFPFPQNRDKNAFYWKRKKPSIPQKSWVFECDEFRHKSDPELFEIGIMVPNPEECEKAAICIRVTAKNMPQPFEFTLPIRITHEESDTEAKAMELLQRELPVLNLEF